MMGICGAVYSERHMPPRCSPPMWREVVVPSSAEMFDQTL